MGYIYSNKYEASDGGWGDSVKTAVKVRNQKEAEVKTTAACPISPCRMEAAGGKPGTASQFQRRELVAVPALRRAHRSAFSRESPLRNLPGGKRDHETKRGVGKECR